MRGLDPRIHAAVPETRKAGWIMGQLSYVAVHPLTQLRVRLVRFP